MMANVSIGSLFLGGVIPGVLMTLFMMITVFIFARIYGWGSDAPFSLRKISKAMLEVAVVFAFPLAVYLLGKAGLPENGAIFLSLGIVLVLDYLSSSRPSWR